MTSVAIIVLTLNEERHIRRCLEHVLRLSDEVYVVDSYSTDATVEIARGLGASVCQHRFRNHADQLAWAIENLPIKAKWVMRVDADEVLSSVLADEIQARLSDTDAATDAYVVPLYVRFQGGGIRHGGYPQWQLRLWRKGKAQVEQRWMDEKIVVQGNISSLRNDYWDDNLNGVAWWTDKHNRYSTREAIDLLNRRHRFLPPVDGPVLTPQASRVRWLKENFYARMPLGLRAFLFFFYRMIFRLGILDGRGGFVFHFLQGCWYRFLVDVKVRSVERRMRADGVDCIEAIRREFGVDPLP